MYISISVDLTVPKVTHKNINITLILGLSWETNVKVDTLADLRSFLTAKFLTTMWIGYYNIFLFLKTIVDFYNCSQFFWLSTCLCISQEIHKKVMSLQFSECHTKIRHVDAHATLSDGVVVQVLGELSNNGQPMRKFMQTFVLAPEVSTPLPFSTINIHGGWVINNVFLRFLA